MEKSCFFLLVSEVIICDQHMCLNSPVSRVIGIDRDRNQASPSYSMTAFRNWLHIKCNYIKFSRPYEINQANNNNHCRGPCGLFFDIFSRVNSSHASQGVAKPRWITWTSIPIERWISSRLWCCFLRIPLLGAQGNEFPWWKIEIKIVRLNFTSFV